MIFEGLADRLQETFKKLRGHGRLTEDDVNEAMRDVRMALLEADVNFKVVKDFVKKVKERAVGQEVLETLTPAQVVIKIVDEELTSLMGGTQSKINISPKPPTIIMLVGLQGAGKTTSAGKLGVALKKKGKRPILVAADIYRHGIYLTGGASQVSKLAQLMSKGTGLKVNVSENPISSVALGLAKIINDDNYRNVAYSIEGMSK